MNRFVPTYQLYGEQIGESADFWLHCETIPERSRLHGWEIRPHRHDAFFQILYISDGGGEVLMRGAYRRFESPAIVFMPPGEAHGFRFSRDIGGLVLTVTRDRLDALAAGDRQLAAFAAAPGKIDATSEPTRTAIDNLRRIAAEIAGHRSSRMAMIEALTTSVLIDLARAVGDGQGAFADSGGRDQMRVEQLTALVAAHAAEHRPVAFYAGQIGVSAAHLNRIARAATGHSLQELVNARLLEEAKRNLVFTHLPAQSIGLALGFSDPAYFSRFFRKHACMPPAAFRKAQRDKLRY